MLLCYNIIFGNVEYFSVTRLMFRSFPYSRHNSIIIESNSTQQLHGFIAFKYLSSECFFFFSVKLLLSLFPVGPQFQLRSVLVLEQCRSCWLRDVTFSFFSCYEQHSHELEGKTHPRSIKNKLHYYVMNSHVGHLQ